MKTTISKILYMTRAEHEAFQMAIYFEWCLRMAKELGYPEQSLMANTAICKWFNTELQTLENEAYQTLCPRYGQMTQDKARTIYGAITADIYKNYPKALFEAAKKLNIDNEPHGHSAN